MRQIERGIFYEDAYLGVTVGALSYSHGVILIDAPLRAEDARSWRAALINQRGGTNRLLINLDSHPDRTLGARAMDCTVVAHQKAAQVFRNRSTIFKGQSVPAGAVWETYSEAIGLRWASPDVTFTEHMSLHWGGPEVRLEHQPGPTPGSIWISIPDAGVVFVGDTVVLNQPPFLAYADLNVWTQGLKLLTNQYKDFRVIAGRGGLAAQEEIVSLQSTFSQIIEQFDRLARSGAPPEATQELIPEFLSKYRFPAEMRDLYSTRLKVGLYQSFVRRYRTSNASGHADLEDEEQ
jgi:glyoxylase-like metal-dependent hydrolase (beta-lactamase superfamily II)